MVSMIAIGGEVFGSCTGEIIVSVELKNGDGWPCCGFNYLRLILGRKRGSRLTEEGDSGRY